MHRLSPLQLPLSAALLALASLLPASAALAQVLEASSDATIRDRLCVGGECADDPSPEFVAEGATSSLELRDTRIRIDFVDTSTPSFPDTSWAIEVNEPNLSIPAGGTEYFAVEDLSAGTVPFKIMGGAPTNALYLSETGQMGLGTSMPTADLHIIGDAVAPSIRLDDVAGTPGTWDIAANNNNFYIEDVTNSSFPVVVEDAAPTYALYVEDSGDVGLGTDAPEGKLHTKGDGVQLAYFESGDGGPVQVRFRTDSENRRFLAVNNANEVKSQIIFLDDRINFTGQTDSGANLWLSIGPDGIISQGPTCNPGPCDRTFDRGFFTVPPIEDRAAQMWKQQHLPGIGPTQPHAPINLTEKMGGVIHELEVAHIYIEQLHAQLASAQAQLDAQSAAIAELTAWRAQIDGAALR